MEFKLERVTYMPKDLQPRILYISEEFQTAAHLCPCGCGSKIRTPLGPTEWAFKETNGTPSLHPSIGNWQRKCQSHYFITEGKIIWARQWSKEQIEAGRRHEQQKRQAFYNRKPTLIQRITAIIKKLFS